MQLFKSNGFPLQPHDSEGVGAGTRRPLVPQEVARLQRRSSFRKGDEGKVALLLLKVVLFCKIFSENIFQSRLEGYILI
ncbi:hypothetical protein ACQCVP_15635 [Rossellomorea vietnamensis]